MLTIFFVLNMFSIGKRSYREGLDGNEVGTNGKSSCSGV